MSKKYPSRPKFPINPLQTFCAWVQERLYSPRAFLLNLTPLTPVRAHTVNRKEGGGHNQGVLISLERERKIVREGKRVWRWGLRGEGRAKSLGLGDLERAGELVGLQETMCLRREMVKDFYKWIFKSNDWKWPCTKLLLHSCADAFEAFHDDSWHAIKDVRIKHGSVTGQFEHHGSGTWEVVPPEKLRLRPRKASPSDCRCFLRPGMDVCVFSVYSDAAVSEQENTKPAWRDAKIISIEKEPHDPRCTCKYSVSIYTNQDQLGKRKRTCENCIEDITIDNIAILQKLKRERYEDGCYHRDYSEDCPSVHDSKLLLAKFSSEVSWLIVLSIFNKIDIRIRSIGEKIVYLFLNRDQGAENQDAFYLGSDDVKAISFHRENGEWRPKIESFVPVIFEGTFVQPRGIDVDCTDFPYAIAELRHSTRQRGPPDFFAGCGFSNAKHCLNKSSRMKLLESDILSFPADDISEDKNRLEEKIKGRMISYAEKDESDKTFSLTRWNVELMQNNNCSDSIGQENSSLASGNTGKQKPTEYHENQNKMDIWNCDCLLDEEHLTCQKKTCNKGNLTPKISSHCHPPTKSQGLLVKEELDPDELPDDINLRTWIELIRKCSSKHQNCCTIETEKKSEKIEMHLQEGRNVKLHSGKRFSLDRVKKGSQKKTKSGKVFYLDRLKQKGSDKKLQFNSYRRKCRNEERRYRNRFYSTSEYKQIIDRCMKNIEHEIGRQQPLLVTQWEAKQAINKSNTILEFNWEDDIDDHTESIEHEDLWNEMENALTALPVTSCQEESMDFLDAIPKRQSCQHEYKLEEEVGVMCALCNSIITEIKYVLPPFLSSKVWARSEGQCSRDKRESTGAYSFSSDPLGRAIPSSEMSTSQHLDNVWSLIPNLKLKLHDHQIKAFEFLWRNIAGSLNPTEMELASEKWGGCVISHPPGAGKTLLVISFLESYLTLFPRMRPLILAPTTSLYAWHKEFEKWEVSFPIYQIQPLRGYQKQRKAMPERQINESIRDLTRDGTILHFTDCLEKLRKWHEQPSALLMSYPSFFAMTRSDSRFEHRRYISEVLRKSPGILILDEGHNPRSTRSKLRRALMEVKTDLRILLSGTLFQNNFEEYFNTLSLARPRFIHEVATELKIRNLKRGKSATNIRKEKLARKHFVEKIAKRINSTIDKERKRGLEMLKKVTDGFIDIYNGITLDRLPGLQCYTLLMKPTDMQQKILTRLQQSMPQKRYPLEVELLITFASIHPWLIKTVSCVGKYFSKSELEILDVNKFNIGKGTKAKFVVDLVRQCIKKKEKVLIFCRNIPPINLFVEIFERVLRWKRDKEVLVLQGEMDLIERARVMEKFKEYGGSSQLLLASTAACAEGISLTAASRVVMLDSEWNPSKTKQAIARAFRPGQERVVYVYQLLASGTIEEGKYDTKEMKARQSRMIFSGGCVEDSSHRQTDNIDDDVLREIVEEDETKAFHMIMKHEKISNSLGKGNQGLH